MAMRPQTLASALLLALAAPALAEPASLPRSPEAPGAVPRSAPLPDWMAGTWSMEDGSAWTEELWTSSRGDMMLGMSRSGFGPKIESWESVRIVVKPGGGVTYIAQPKGGAPTEFPLTVASDQAIEFANPHHDFPQRIRYWRQGQLLMAEISMIDGSRAMRWNYRPVAGPPLDGVSPQEP